MFQWNVTLPARRRSTGSDCKQVSCKTEKRANCSLVQNRIGSGVKLAARVGEVSSRLTDIETPRRHRQVSRAESAALDRNLFSTRK